MKQERTLKADLHPVPKPAVAENLTGTWVKVAAAEQISRTPAAPPRPLRTVIAFLCGAGQACIGQHGRSNGAGQAESDHTHSCQAHQGHPDRAVA